MTIIWDILIIARDILITLLPLTATDITFSKKRETFLDQIAISGEVNSLPVYFICYCLGVNTLTG